MTICIAFLLVLFYVQIFSFPTGKNSNQNVFSLHSFRCTMSPTSLWLNCYITVNVTLQLMLHYRVNDSINPLKLIILLLNMHNKMFLVEEHSYKTFTPNKCYSLSILPLDIEIVERYAYCIFISISYILFIVCCFFLVWNPCGWVTHRLKERTYSGSFYFKLHNLNIDQR